MAQRTLIVGISGASSSGKTTLARLLRDVWSNTIILHEDDFYWPDDKIPIKNGVQDWDCIEALDVHRLEQTLIYLRTHGSLPPGLKSKEDKNSAGESGVHQSTINQWRSRVDALVASRPTRSMAIIEGFLLYSQKMESIWKLFDVKLFLHTKCVNCDSMTVHGHYGRPHNPRLTCHSVTRQQSPGVRRETATSPLKASGRILQDTLTRSFGRTTSRSTLSFSRMAMLRRHQERTCVVRWVCI